MAAWFEGRGAFARAAELYSECGQFQRALGLFLRCGEAELPRAIDMAGRARSDVVTHALIDFLMGEADGAPKDPKWVFKLYLALGDFAQASKTAGIIADQEQRQGNYKVAHGVLLETCRALQAAGARRPRALARALQLLHSYLLVRRLVKLEAHEAAARMCVRVSRSISRFPEHVVPILTSTVIECVRAGLKRSAFEFACVLMRPEHRDAIEEKFRKKVEALVRRPSDEELEEERAPCPFCAAALPATAQACETCKSSLPMCVLTGRFVTADDVGACPCCRFPASLAGLRALAAAPAEADRACPMCGGAVDARALAAAPQLAPGSAEAVAALRLAADGEVADGDEEEREANAAAAAAAAVK